MTSRSAVLAMKEAAKQAALSCRMIDGEPVTIASHVRYAIAQAIDALPLPDEPAAGDEPKRNVTLRQAIDELRALNVEWADPEDDESTIPPVDVMGLLEAYEKAAKMHGWMEDQGSRHDEELSKKELETAKNALVAAIAALQRGAM